MEILIALSFISFLIGLFFLALYFYEKAFIEWHDGKLRGVTKEAQNHKEIVDEINREIRKLDKKYEI